MRFAESRFVWNTGNCSRKRFRARPCVAEGFQERFGVPGVFDRAQHERLVARVLDRTPYMPALRFIDDDETVMEIP